MKRSNVFGIALLAMLALSALTASSAWAKGAKPVLVLLYEGAPAQVGEAAYAGIVTGQMAGECNVTTEGTLTANKKKTDRAAFSRNVAGSCGEAGYSITGVVKSAKLSTKGKMSFTSDIILSAPGPCNYSIKKYNVPFNTNGKEATDGEGEVTAKLSKAGSSPSCKTKKTLKVPLYATLLNREDGLYGTETQPQPKESAKAFEVTDKVHLASEKMWSAFGSPPKWWVGGTLLVGSEPIAEETTMTNPFKLEFALALGKEKGGSVGIACTKEKIKNGMIEAPGSRTEEAEVYEGCEVVGQPQCSVGSIGTPGTITTNALKATLEAGTPEKLKFVPESGSTIATFEINETAPSCAENNFVFKADGEMICNYEKVENEELEHPLEFIDGESKVEVEGPQI